jgi:hypothetical protein
MKWLTEKPTFEQVKDKRIYFEFYANQPAELFDGHRTIKTIGDYNYVFDRDVDFAHYAILDLSDTYCEWEKLPDCNGITHYYVSSHKLDMLKQGGDFCPHCGNPIKIVEDEQPLELDGVKPEIKQLPVGTWEWKWMNGYTHYSQAGLISKECAIESWNVFVKKLL